MVAEESETKIPAVVCSETPENPLPADASGDSRGQIALKFDSEGNHQTVTEAPGAHDGRRSSSRKSRYDTRRTADYLAERGRLPAESLHLITRRTLAEAVAYIRKTVPGSSHQWAADYYLHAIELLLPYCHLKQSDLEGAGGLDGVHTLVAGHFLAASAMGRVTSDATLGARGALSGSQQLLDGQNGSAQRDASGAHTMPHTIQGTVVTLPPRGKD